MKNDDLQEVHSWKGHRRLSIVSVVVIAVSLVAVLIAATVVVVLLGYGGQATIEPPDGVKNFDIGAANRHTDDNVRYQQNPPVGGKHDPIWQNCGFYSESVRNENAVHSMEHGAVWITYRPNLPQAEVDSLRKRLLGQTYLLASPYENLPAPVVASAWGKQVRLEGADDPDLSRFIQVYRQGSQTPEPGAVCTGGVGQPS